jgi:hypothetical protein
MEDSPASRQATKARIGPWYVLQSRNPAAPGMRYATLLALIHRGHVTARSVVRGPTTHQLWRFAAHVRGVSREFDVCYSCGGTIDRSASLCPHCQRLQDPPSDPDVLLESRGPRAVVSDDTPSHSQRLRDLNRARKQAEQRGGNHSDGQARSRSDLIGDDGRVLSGMNLAAALQSAREPVRRPRWRKLKAAAVVVLLAGVVGAALLYARPELRANTIQWARQSWHTVQAKWTASQDSLAPAAPKAPVVVPPAKRDLAAHREPAAPRQSANVATSAPATTAPIAAGEATRRPQAPTVVVAGDPLEQARTLWRAAIDADARRDFAAAAQIYQQIKQLPSDVWPAGLQLRLELAQKRAGQSSAN